MAVPHFHHHSNCQNIVSVDCLFGNHVLWIGAAETSISERFARALCRTPFAPDSATALTLPATAATPSPGTMKALSRLAAAACTLVLLCHTMQCAHAYSAQLFGSAKCPPANVMAYSTKLENGGCIDINQISAKVRRRPRTRTAHHAYCLQGWRWSLPSNGLHGRVVRSHWRAHV